MALDIKKLGKLSLAILENFVESKLGKKFVDELRAPTDKTIAVATALNETENIFKQSFADKDLAKALFVDLTQQDRPELIEAVGKYYDHPTDPTLRTSLQRILFDEFKQHYAQDFINHAVDFYLRTLTKELMLADETFRDNVASLATLEGSLAEKQTSETLNKIYETMAGWAIQQQISPPVEVHPTIGFIPPPKVTAYIDRGQIEDDLVSFLLKGGRGAIVGVHAPGGLGKTELAKKTARKLASQYELLWIDVGEKKPQQVIGEVLTKSGVQIQPNASYESLKNELQFLYQQKRFLIIFDDVRKDALDALSDFLPPSPHSALVTSRVQQIAGVTNFELKPMTWEQAQKLFRAILEDEIVNAELEMLEKLADRCKFNPLAMEIAARRILQYQGLRKPVAKYFEIAQAKIAELKMDGNARWDMQVVFDISYQDLSTDDREKFESLAAFHHTGFSIEAVAHLWDLEISLARQILSRFINLSLVKIVETDYEALERYRLHDLLDEYATEKLKTSKKLNERKAKLAEWLINIFDDNFVPNVENLPLLLPEKDNLLYACEWARGEKQAEILALLTTKTLNWFNVNFRDSWIYWIAWLEACLQLGVSDKQLEANVRKAIGDVQQFLKENDAALESYNEALKLFRQVGAKLGEANTLQSLGKMQIINANDQESFQTGMNTLQSAMGLYEETNEMVGQTNILMFLSRVSASMGQNDKAIEIAQAALKLLIQVAGENHPVTLSFLEYIKELQSNISK